MQAESVDTRSRALEAVEGEISQLSSENAALVELEAQLSTDEESLDACIEVVRAECERLSTELGETSGHVSDIDQQIAAAVEDDLGVATELDLLRRRVRDVDDDLAALEGELGRYRRQMVEAREVVDATFQHTLRMEYRLRHESAFDTLGGRDCYGEDEAEP